MAPGTNATMIGADMTAPVVKDEPEPGRAPSAQKLTFSSLPHHTDSIELLAAKLEDLADAAEAGRDLAEAVVSTSLEDNTLLRSAEVLSAKTAMTTTQLNMFEMWSAGLLDLPDVDIRKDTRPIPDQTTRAKYTSCVRAMDEIWSSTVSGHKSVRCTPENVAWLTETYPVFACLLEAMTKVFHAERMLLAPQGDIVSRIISLTDHVLKADEGNRRAILKRIKRFKLKIKQSATKRSKRKNQALNPDGEPLTKSQPKHGKRKVAKGARGGLTKSQFKKMQKLQRKSELKKEPAALEAAALAEGTAVRDAQVEPTPRLIKIESPPPVLAHNYHISRLSNQDFAKPRGVKRERIEDQDDGHNGVLCPAKRPYVREGSEEGEIMSGAE